MTNIVESWIKSQTDCGEPLQNAVDNLNKDLGTQYSTSRIGAWRDGKRSIPKPVTRYMIEAALYWVLKQHGLDGMPDNDDNFYTALSNDLSPPDVDNL